MTGTLGPGLGIGKAARFMYIATAGQTTFNGADSSAQALTMNYTPNYVEVIVNGVWLPPQDYTAANGSSVILNSGCVAGDIVYVYALSAFTALLNPFPMPGALWGLTMSTAGSSTTLTVAKGSAADSTNTTMMQLAAAMAKTTSAWAAGTTNGGLDTGAIAINTWYHWFTIYNPITAVTDVVFSATATPAAGPTTMPAGFTLFRRIGSMKTNGSSQWTSFTQLGDEFLWLTNSIDVLGASTTNGSISQTINVPTGLQVAAVFNGRLDANTAGASLAFSSLDQNVPTVGGSATTHLVTSTTSGQSAGRFQIRTNTSGQIRITANATTALLNVVTEGWIDTRGKLS